MKKWEKPILQELDLSKTMDDMSMEFNASGRPSLCCPSCCEIYIWDKGNNYYYQSNILIKAEKVQGEGQTFLCKFTNCPGQGKTVLVSSPIQCS